MTSSYKPEIDGLRALAVLSVIIFHFNASLLPGGYLGVDVFFVISGYLITTVIKKGIADGEFSLPQFYLRRIKRILPALYVMLAVVTVAAAVILLPGDFKDFGRSLLAQSIFGSNIYFYLKSDYFDTPSLLKPLLHTWSLSAEEQFYIIYPMLLFALTKPLKAGAKYAILLLLFAGLAICYFTYQNDKSAAFYLLPSKSWELLLGAVLTYNFTPGTSINKTLRELSAFLGLILIGYAIFTFSKNTQLSGLEALIPALGSGLIIITGSDTIIGKILSARVINYTGKISYSLYLWHWPLLVFFLYRFNTGFTLISGTILFIVAYVLAAISYRYIENPIRYSAKKPRLYFIGALLGMVVFAAMGYYINRKEGLPKRFPVAIQKLLREAQQQTPCVERLGFTKRTGLRYFNGCDTDTAAKPAILLWGDSHSGMITPVLKQLAAQYHQKFAFYSCPSALNVYLANYDKSYTESPCYNSNREIIDFIKANKIRCVLFASAWSQYTEGRELKMEGAGQKDKLYADSLTKSFSTQDARRVFREKMLYTINLLSSIGVDIWIMKQVPQHQFWVPNEVAKRLMYKQDTLKIGRSLTEHYSRQSFVNGVFDELAKNKKVHLLDPTPFFMVGKNFVTAYKNSRSLYFDYNHLSPYGALMLAPMFKPMFLSVAGN